VEVVEPTRVAASHESLLVAINRGGIGCAEQASRERGDGGASVMGARNIGYRNRSAGGGGKNLGGLK